MRYSGLHRLATALIAVSIGVALPAITAWADHVKDLQTAAIEAGRADWGHWGVDPENYTEWGTHSNRLIPVYTFGITLEGVGGKRSAYRRQRHIERLYGRLPEMTLNPAAGYFDQTDVYHLQRRALAAGKKYIVLIVFDGMDWQTTWAAAIHRAGKVGYVDGRGSGLHFQDYRGALTAYGFFVTSPYSDGSEEDVNAQVVTSPGEKLGGYDWRRAGAAPWLPGNDPLYLQGKSSEREHAYTDSASSATSMNAGIKTYNAAINVAPDGRQVVPFARRLQRRGVSIGVVTSVPISHATPAAAYANNVSRNDYQDLTRDLVGLRSIAHREQPLPGVDVLLGGGWGERADEDENQGFNFIPGNKWIADPDLRAIDLAEGGNYRVVTRAPGENGSQALARAAREAAAHGTRLFGLFGADGGNLPFATADGKYDPAPGRGKDAKLYSAGDIEENPTLADMTRAAISVLETNKKGFWLMIEAGDVDWANHDNNLDNSIGAVISGDDAFRAVTDWAEAHDCWDETVVILTADHGHYLMLNRPEALLPAAE